MVPLIADSEGMNLLHKPTHKYEKKFEAQVQINVEKNRCNLMNKLGSFILKLNFEWTSNDVWPCAACSTATGM